VSEVEHVVDVADARAFEFAVQRRRQLVDEGERRVHLLVEELDDARLRKRVGRCNGEDLVLGRRRQRRAVGSDRVRL